MLSKFFHSYNVNTLKYMYYTAIIKMKNEIILQYFNNISHNTAIENKIYEAMIRGSKFEKGTYTCDRSKRRC